MGEGEKILPIIKIPTSDMQHIILHIATQTCKYMYICTYILYNVQPAITVIMQLLINKSRKCINLKLVDVNGAGIKIYGWDEMGENPSQKLKVNEK